MANLQLTDFDAVCIIILLSSHPFLHWVFKSVIYRWEIFCSQLVFFKVSFQGLHLHNTILHSDCHISEVYKVLLNETQNI